MKRKKLIISRKNLKQKLHRLYISYQIIYIDIIKREKGKGKKLEGRFVWAAVASNSSYDLSLTLEAHQILFLFFLLIISSPFYLIGRNLEQ